MKERAGNNPDIHILLIPPGRDVDINALQRASTIIVQKSRREGFGLTVTEALWKAKPVVAAAVGDTFTDEEQLYRSSFPWNTMNSLCIKKATD